MFDTRSTRTVTVHIADEDTWDDVVGEDTNNPKYQLCCGTIWLVGGRRASNIVRNNPRENKIDVRERTISFEWEITPPSEIKYYMEFALRHANPYDPTDETREEIKFGEVYVVQKDIETQDYTANVGLGTDAWGARALNVSMEDEADGVAGHLGIENPVTIQPKLWEEIDGEETQVYGKERDYWISGKGSIAPYSHRKIQIWFEREAKHRSVSTVDQSNKYFLDFRISGDENPAPIEYNEDDGWPKQTDDD